MDDINVSTDTAGAATPAASRPPTAPPKQQSVIEQARDAARKLLAAITGRNRS